MTKKTMKKQTSITNWKSKRKALD